MYQVKQNQPQKIPFLVHQKSADDFQMQKSRFYKQCGICNHKFNQQEFTKIGSSCEHSYCKDCLKYYVLHKIKNQFSVIDCPKDNCKAQMSYQSQVYLDLSENLKNRYAKIIQNLKAISDRSYRICPNCQQTQLNKLQNQDNLLCTKCLIKYCHICLNPAHKKYARCDMAVIGILKRNYMMKRCAKCLFLVQKNQGCNHMTCICKYQFCYQCGGYWNHGDHQCPPKPRYIRPRSVRLIKKQPIQRKVFPLATVSITLNPQKNRSSSKAKGHRLVQSFLPQIVTVKPSNQIGNKLKSSRASTNNSSFVLVGNNSQIPSLKLN